MKTSTDELVIEKENNNEYGINEYNNVSDSRSRRFPNRCDGDFAL